MPKYQHLIMYTTKTDLGIAALPVVTVVRDLATGQWKRSHVRVPEARNWDSVLDKMPETISDEIIEGWKERANGISNDISDHEVEANDLAHAWEIANADLIGRWAITVEEM